MGSRSVVDNTLFVHAKIMVASSLDVFVKECII